MSFANKKSEWISVCFKKKLMNKRLFQNESNIADNETFPSSHCDSVRDGSLVSNWIKFKTFQFNIAF